MAWLARNFAAAISNEASPMSAAIAAERLAHVAAAVSAPSSASCCCTAWNWPIGRPNCLRSSEYAIERSRADCSAPAICAVRARAACSKRLLRLSTVGRCGQCSGAVELEVVTRLVGEIRPLVHACIRDGQDDDVGTSVEGHRRHDAIDVATPWHARQSARESPPASVARKRSNRVRSNAEPRPGYFQRRRGQQFPRNHCFSEWQRNLPATGSLQDCARIVPVRAAAAALFGNEDVHNPESFDLVPAAVRLEQTGGAVGKELSLLAHVSAVRVRGRRCRAEFHASRRAS